MKKVFLFFCIGILSVFSQENNRGYIVNVGEKAPIIEITDPLPLFLSNPEKAAHFFLSNFQKVGENPVIMLKFTASWCSVCMKEMPVIEKEIWEQYKDNENFVLIALAKDTEKRPQRKKEIKLIREKTGATFPIITDYNSKIFELFAEEEAGVTRSIIIDQNGEIAFLTRLFDHDEFNEMKSVINQLLNNN